MRCLLPIRILCALILVGALFACSSQRLPVVPPTLTLIVPTITATFPPTATLQPTESAPGIAPVLTPSAAADSLEVLLPGSETPQPDLVKAMMDDLARDLEVSAERIRIVMIASMRWVAREGACPLVDHLIELPTDPRGLRSLRGLRYTFLIGSSLYDYYTTAATAFERCAPVGRLSDQLLLELDPGAREILLLAQRRLAEELDLSTRHISLVTIVPILWQDTSLGCPLPDQRYQSVPIQGYRIILEAGERQYIFHSDTVSIFACPAGQEQLPAA
jgi:hypothetical protein